MIFRDLGDFIKALEDEGELLKIDGAHWDSEIGAIAELMVKRGGPALLFDHIADYPPGYRVFSNGLLSEKRTAMVLGIPQNLTGLEMVKAWRRKLREFKPIPCHQVDNGAVKQNVRTGADVNLLEFPTPKWHEFDGGRYPGTASGVITRDPEEGWINVGTYRCMIQSENKISVKLNKGKHGRVMMDKYHAKGLPCPIAISFGHDPYLYVAASNSGVLWGLSEYEWAGGLKGEPELVTTGVVTDLPIPANAEIVIEGEIPPNWDQLQEGPFGEWMGYYADTTTGIVPVMNVKSVLYRDAPIIFGAPPFKPPYPYHLGLAMIAGDIWNHLDMAGMTGVTGVWIPARFDFPMALFIAIDQTIPGQPMQVALQASSCPAAKAVCKFVVVVDSDVDITNTDEVLWAMLTRADLSKITTIPDVPAAFADPLMSMEQREIHDITTTRVIINACRPSPWGKPFASVNEVSAEYSAKVLKKWSRLFR